MTDARILVIDDEPSLRKLLEMSFKSRPWHVDTVSTAEEGLERCRAERYDLLLLDKNLPGMSGPEMLRALRDEGDTASCIMMTAFASSESAVEMMALGVDAYVEKPFPNLEDVGAKVEAILRERSEGQRRSKSLAEARDHFRRAQEALGVHEAPAGLDIVVACPGRADRDFLREQLAADDLQFVSSSAELLGRLASGSCDLVIVDAAIAQVALADFVEQLRRLAPAPGLVVVTEALPLKAVTALIDVGVDVLVERPLKATSFRRNAEHLLGRLRS